MSSSGIKFFDRRPGGHEQPPSKKPKISEGVAPKNLRELYIRILKLMLKYRTAYGVVPRGNSSEFYEFVRGEGLADISKEKLTRALLFMEESFENTVGERGLNVHFMDRYLDERFQLSKQVWGPLREERNNQDRYDHHGKGKTKIYERPVNYHYHEEAAVVDNFDDPLFDDIDDIDDLDVVVDEKQDALDIAILRTIREFKIKNDGKIPEQDSDDLYRFLVSLSFCTIQHDQLVDRILILEEKFNSIETRTALGDIVGFPTASRREIYDLSKMIWDDSDEFYNDHDDGDVADDGENRVDEQDQGGHENREDQEDDQGGVENIGDQQDDEGGVKNIGDEQDDPGSVEDLS